MKEVYLDNSATTMSLPTVSENWLQHVMCEDYGNPSSLHRQRRGSRKIYKRSKRDICQTFKGTGKRNIFSHPEVRRVIIWR